MWTIERSPYVIFKFSMENITLDQLVELAKEADIMDPIEWGETPIEEDLVYYTFAEQMIKAYNSTARANRDLVFLAAIIKLHTHVFALRQHNLQLLNTIDMLQE